MNHGFIKVAAAVPPVAVADCRKNAEGMAVLAERAASAGVGVRPLRSGRVLAGERSSGGGGRNNLLAERGLYCPVYVFHRGCKKISPDRREKPDYFR